MDESLTALLTFTTILGAGTLLMIVFNIFWDRAYKKIVAETGVAAKPFVRTTWGFSVAAVLTGCFGFISGVLLLISYLKGRVQSRSEVELARASLYNTLWSFVALGLTIHWLMGVLNASG